MPKTNPIGTVADLFGTKGEMPWLFKKKKKIEFKKVTKPRLSEYEDQGDFLLTMIMVALMHVNPDKSAEEVIEEGREWAKKLWMPNMKHRWRTQAIRIKRRGVRAEASKIRREMYKLL